MLNVVVNGTLDHRFDLLAFGLLLGLLVEVEQVGIGKRVLVELVTEAVFAGAVRGESWREGWGI